MTHSFALFLPIAFSSYCGKSGVPYSFEVLESGAPVLGCAQPSCVISPDDFEEDSEFLTDANGQADGYFREGDRALKRYRHDNAPKLVANCSGGFSQLSCPRKNQWVGGIEYIDHPRQPLILQCCSFDGLRFSQEVGMTVVNSGEAVTGGEVIRNGRQISFDVIANVRKIVQPGHGHKPSYEVTVRRMNCLPDPPEPEVEFDKDVPSEVLKVLSTAKNGKDLGTKEKFEKMSQQKNNPIKQQKKQKKIQEPAQFGAKQHAAESQNSITVDSSGSANIVPLSPAAPTQSAIPVQPQLPPQQQQQQQQSLPQQPAYQYPSNSQTPYQPQPINPQPYPGYGSPAGGFQGFPAAPTPAPGFGTFPTFPTFAPFGVTPSPLAGGQATTTSTWDAALAAQPPRPTYPNGVTVFPTMGTAFMTPLPPHTFAPMGGAGAAGGSFSGLVTPVPPVPPRQGTPEHMNLPDLARPPPLPRLEEQISQQGSGAAISSVNGGSSTSGSAPAANSNAQAQAAPTVQGGSAPAAAPGFPQAPQPSPFQHPSFPGFPPHQPLPTFQPFTFPPHPTFAPHPTFPPHPQFTFPTHPPHHHQFTFPGFPAPGSAAASASGGEVPAPGLTPPPFPPMPTFSFPTLPPVHATTPHPLFTLPPPPQHIAGGQSQNSAPIQQQPQLGPAPPPSAASATGPQAQGTLLFPAGIAPIQFQGLSPIGGSQKKA